MAVSLVLELRSNLRCNHNRRIRRHNPAHNSERTPGTLVRNGPRIRHVPRLPNTLRARKVDRRMLQFNRTRPNNFQRDTPRSGRLATVTLSSNVAESRCLPTPARQGARRLRNERSGSLRLCLRSQKWEETPRPPGPRADAIRPPPHRAAPRSRPARSGATRQPGQHARPSPRWRLGWRGCCLYRR